MLVIEMTLTKDTYDVYNPKLVAYGTNEDYLSVYRRTPTDWKKHRCTIRPWLKFVFSAGYNGSERHGAGRDPEKVWAGTNPKAQAGH